ncbi:MAG TPA: hypothetical protein VHD36_23725 [Pirellulales bacterium]|nr:hypothetical protein [Pirellulales bacterium]
MGHDSAASENRRRTGFDFTRHLREVCRDMAARLPELRHVDMDRVALRVCQTRNRAHYGVHASLTPLRFEGGSRTTIRRGRTWAIRPVCDEQGREMLYLLSFYLPRFCDQPLAEKVATIIHELWHIGPHFDGDLRRFPGRYFAHGRSEAAFHRQMHAWAAEWLEQSPGAELYAFLGHDFRSLCQQFGGVIGTRIPTPKLIPVAKTSA